MLRGQILTAGELGPYIAGLCGMPQTMLFLGVEHELVLFNMMNFAFMCHWTQHHLVSMLFAWVMCVPLAVNLPILGRSWRFWRCICRQPRAKAEP